ncbi:fumarylacetoacetate hydrolase family protein [Knoellia sp. S7-12]|uniref:2-keto-4-pentenoate hydratase n=1 Tax=Knoellia sp. S7-12 TaxID=3126698 RepID=UPI003369769A
MTVSPEPTTDPESDTAVLEAVERLESASRTGKPCPPVRDLIGESDLERAYAVQHSLAARRRAAGARVVGRKIGLTSPAVQRQLGVEQPDFGLLFDDMNVSGLATVPTGSLLQPRVEAEVAFVLRADLDQDGLNLGTVRRAVDHAVAALEIVDSRIAGWDIRITDTVADNGSSALFVLGEKQVRLDEFDPIAVTMRMTADDVLVSEGNGAACLGDPLLALLWLARTAQEVGDPLRAGQVVLSGALGPMHSVTPGTVISAEISALGTVSVTFASDAPEPANPPTPHPTSSPKKDPS